MTTSPNFEAYHRSISNELVSIKNRIRNLVKHWGTDGEYKEAALRSVLRRHLPERFLVGRGFIVNKSRASRQIDVLIIDSTAPTLFKDGDLFIVTPSSVRAVIEVKTKLRNRSEVEKALRRLVEAGNLCRDGYAGLLPWLGLFTYEGLVSHEDVLQSIAGITSIDDQCVNCICIGSVMVNLLSDHAWRSYDLGELAPSYFLGNLVYATATEVGYEGSYAWFPIHEGKEIRKRFEMKSGDVAPRPCEV